MGESGGVKSRVTAIDESDILAAVDSYSSWDYGNFAKNDVDYSKRISAKTGLGLSSLMGGKKLKKPERKRLPSSSSSSSGDSDDEAKKSKKRRVKRMQAEFIIEDLDDFEEEKVERAVEISKMKSKADPVLEGLRNIRNRVESMTNDFDPLQSPGEQLQSDEISSKKVLIKVLISGHVQRYQLLSTAPFQEILNQIADENACPMSAVLLSLKERRVEPTDTPASLGLGIADLFECFIDQSWKIEKAKQEETRLAKENQLELKFQTQDRRSAVTLMVTKSMTFEEIRTIYVEKRSDKVEPSRVRFVFDGENVELDSSPEDLDMDNGDCIDVLIKL